MTIPTHLSRETGPEERGWAFGRAQQAPVANTIWAYRRLFGAKVGLDTPEIRRLGVQVGDRLDARWPDLRAEISALAAGAGQDEAELLAINARTEILSSAGHECSTIGLLPDQTTGHTCVLAQNWDWHPDADASRVLWTVVEGDGWFTTLTEAGILAKIGLNSQGLGVCLNLLHSSADGGIDGAPIHILLRLLLQRCTNLSQALLLLLNTPASASSCITVGLGDEDAGMVVAAEVSPGGVGLVWPEDGRLVHTNHFVMPLTEGVDTGPKAAPGTLVRYHVLRHELERRTGHLDEAVVMEILSSHLNWPKGVCNHDRENPDYTLRGGTLASVVMDLTRRRMAVTDGAPCCNPYEPVAAPVAEAATSGV